MNSTATLNSLPAPMSKTGSAYKVGAGFGFFFLLWVFLWVLFFSFRPSCVRYCDESTPYPRGEGVCDNRPADPARCLVWSLVLTFIIMIIVWLVSSAK